MPLLYVSDVNRWCSYARGKCSFGFSNINSFYTYTKMFASEFANILHGNPFYNRRLIENSLSLDEKDKYARIFQEADTRNMRFLTGLQAREIFLKSGLSNRILAHIWYLVDVNNYGFITLDKFCLAMHMIHLIRQGLLKDEFISVCAETSQKLKELVEVKGGILIIIKDLNITIWKADGILKENEHKILELRNRIQQVTSLTKKHSYSLDIINEKIFDHGNLVAQLKNSAEGYQLKLNFSKQEYIKLRNYWENLDSSDSKFEELEILLDEKNKDVLALEEKFHSYRNFVHKKSRMIEILKNKQMDRNKISEIDFSSSTQSWNLLKENRVTIEFLHDPRNPEYDSEISIDANLDEKFRYTRICELVATEETYVNDLLIIFEVFYSSIKSENLLNENEIDRIFMNLEDIMLCGKQFLNALNIRLQEYKSSDSRWCIGDIIYENIQLMDPYIDYCSYQLSNTTLLQNKMDLDPKIKEAHKRMCRHPKANGLSLSSFLLKPVQRITRYPLLIEQILKSTFVDSKDFKLLSMAKMKAIELCNVINEASRERQNIHYLTWIQDRVQCDTSPEKLNFNSETNCLGPRKYLHSGSLFKVRSNKELMGLLFTDFMLLTLPNKPIGYASSIFNSEIRPNVLFKSYRNPLLLNEISVFKSSDDESQSAFKIVHKNKTYHLKTISNVERDTWVKKVDSASKYFCDFEKKRKIKPDIKQKIEKPIGRLLVFLQEGINLATLSSGDVHSYCEVRVGRQEQKSKTVSGSTNPKWNSFMQFSLTDNEVDVLNIAVLAKRQFSTNVFLGRAEIPLCEIASTIKETKKPLIKHSLLHGVDSGEVIIKLDLQFYDNWN